MAPKDYFLKQIQHPRFYFFTWSIILSCSTAAGKASVAKTLDRTSLQQFPNQTAIFRVVIFAIVSHEQQSGFSSILIEKKGYALNSNCLTQKPTRIQIYLRHYLVAHPCIMFRFGVRSRHTTREHEIASYVIKIFFADCVILLLLCLR